MYVQNNEFSRRHLENFTSSKIFRLNKKHIRLLEETDLIRPNEKAQILQLTTSTRMTTEVFIWSDYMYDKKLDLWIEDETIVALIEKLLARLPFRFFKGKFYRKHSDKNDFEEVVFFQVCTNEVAYRYIFNYWQTFSAHEHGVLYGYPITTILAFLNMLERFPGLTDRRVEYSYAMEAIGPGFYSMKYFEEEKSHYEKIWKEIMKISPIIIKEAEDYYKKWHEDNFKIIK